MPKRIFYVDDDPQIGKMYKTALEKRGYKIFWHTNPKKAKEELSKNPDFDLILLDVLMPGQTGLELLEAIKQPDSPAKDIPVYILSNIGRQDAIEKGISLGAVAYLIKTSTLPSKLADELDNFFSSSILQG